MSEPKIKYAVVGHNVWPSRSVSEVLSKTGLSVNVQLLDTMSGLDIQCLNCCLRQVCLNDD